MAGQVKVKMLRAIGGFDVGAQRELSAADAKRLEARGVVKIVEQKAESAPANKAEAKVSNKSAKA